MTILSASFLPWTVTYSGEHSSAGILVTIVAVGALSSGLVSLLAPLWVRLTLVPDALTVAFGFAALLLSALYAGRHAGDINLWDQVYPSGLQLGPVYAATAGSVLVVTAGLAGLREMGELRQLDWRLPSAVLAQLAIAVILMAAGMVAPFSVDPRRYGDTVRTLWDDSTNLPILVDAIVLLAVFVVGLVGAPSWVLRRLRTVFAVVTPVALIWVLVTLIPGLGAHDHHPFGVVAVSAAVLCQTAALVLLIRKGRLREARP